MNSFGRLSSPAVAAAFDLSRFRRLVALGGSGQLALTLCECYHELQSAVFDLPAAISTAHECLDRSPLRDRVDLIAGDFFVEPLPEADLFASKNRREQLLLPV